MHDISGVGLVLLDCNAFRPYTHTLARVRMYAHALPLPSLKFALIWQWRITDDKAHIYTRAHTRTHARTHIRTHARTHIHTHTRAQESRDQFSLVYTYPFSHI